MTSPPQRRYRVTLALLVMAVVAFSFMQTMVLPALPFFQREFDTSAAWTSWIASMFLVSSSVLTPILGKLGDMYGKQRVLVIALCVFGAASLLAAFAWNLPSLVFCRALQGAGGAIFPISFGIIRDEFPSEKVGVSIGTVTSVFGVGGGVGLVLSGVILEHLNWHWFFLVGALPVLATALLVWLLVPESPIKTRARPDYLGAAVLALALIALLVAISGGNRWGWGSERVLGLVALTGGLLAAWLAIERRVREPMVDLDMLARPTMAMSNLSAVLIGFTIFSMFVLVPPFVQGPAELPAELHDAGYGFAASPVAIGIFFVPHSLAMIAAGPLGGAAAARFGGVAPLRAGALLMAAGLGLLATVHDERWLVYVWMALIGAGIAVALAALGNLVIATANREETGIAAGMNNIMRTTGGALGAQSSAAVLSAHTLPGTEVPSETGFTLAFALAAGTALAAQLPALVLGRARRARRRAPAARA